MKTGYCKSKKTTLYAAGAKGKVLEWSIWADKQFIVMEYGEHGGKMQRQEEHVPCGLQSRTIEEQIKMRIRSRINKQKDKGYEESLEKAKSGKRTNALGYKRAQKCAAYNGKDSILDVGKAGAIVQPKLNGHHAHVVKDNGKLVMYSNGGKVIDTMQHILDSLEIPEGRMIEGELYIHGMPLQEISSLVTKYQAGESEKIQYHIYDIDNDELAENNCYSVRMVSLSNCIRNTDHVKLVNGAFLTGEFNVEKMLEAHLINKFEGTIVRKLGYAHKDGQRTNAIIKVKPRHFDHFRIDDEFLVVSISSSADGWAVLHCETELGKSFKVSCCGTIEERTKVLENKNDYIGKHIRCEFECYTKDKRPFQPVALEWREKNEE